MPVSKLFVEGKLEIEVLTPILAGTPLLQRGGSKNELRPQARRDCENNVVAAYLRDRDFDHCPPEDMTVPTVDASDGRPPFGWRWCRHEIENYLIDPAIVAHATAWPAHEIETAICQAALRIRSYQAARWTIGIVRRALPPNYKLETRPDGVNELGIPADLTRDSVNAWATGSIAHHRAVIAAATDPMTVNACFGEFADRFNDAFVAGASNVLAWFSGKDLLAGMADWLATKGFANPGDFRAIVRDWMIANPQRVLEMLPEWKALTIALRA